MPTYLYECENCGRFEEFQKITDDPLQKCPECGEEVKKIIGSPGIIFKGSGFYSTDNKSGSSTVKNGASDSKKKGSEKTEKTGKLDDGEKAS
ncbi:MAG TPA: FmdB family zinc ribbon protein [Halanaerobiales bacterium]|nr:FmdB family zinc ribbon protein [Halanaerobiales bacterium]